MLEPLSQCLTAFDLKSLATRSATLSDFYLANPATLLRTKVDVPFADKKEIKILREK